MQTHLPPLPKLLVGLTAAAALIALGMDIQRALPSSTGAAATLSSPTVANTGATDTTQDDPRIDFIRSGGDGGVWALTWGPDGDLWYVAAGNGPLRVVRWHAIDGSTKQWSLTDAPDQPSSVETFIVVDKNGIVWAGVGYVVAALDPVSGTWTAQFNLPLADPGASSDALDPGSPQPGTWINGLALDADGNVLMTRHNVLSLFKITAAGIQVARSLPSAPDGLETVGTDVTPFQKGANGAFVPIGATPAVPACHVGGFGSSSGMQLFTSSGTSITHPLDLNPGSIAASPPLTASPAFIGVAVTGAGVLTRFSCTTGQIQDFALRSSPVTRQPNPVSPPRKFSAHTQPQALAIRSDGWLAFSDSDGRVGVIK